MFNNRIKNKLQLFCKFHTHLSNIVYGLKLQVLKLYNEGICETTDYNKEDLKGVTRYNIICNELTANLKSTIEPRKQYLEFLKEDGFNNPNIEDNSHIEKRRNRYKSLNRLNENDLNKIKGDIEKYFTTLYAVLPDWFYNRLLDTYVVFNKDIDTIAYGNVKIPYKFQGFNFALLLQDALEVYGDEIIVDNNDMIFTYTSTRWNNDNEDIIRRRNFTQKEREKELQLGLQNFKLSPGTRS